MGKSSNVKYFENLGVDVFEDQFSAHTAQAFTQFEKLGQTGGGEHFDSRQIEN